MPALCRPEPQKSEKRHRMLYDEEKDYMMRMIREISRVLFSILFGKKYTQVELEIRNKYETAGTPQNALKDLKKGIVKED